MAAIITILDFAKSGEEDWTSAFEEAFRQISEAGGGILDIPAGEYTCGPWELPDSIELRINEGALVRFIPRFDLYMPVQTRWEGVDCWAMHPLIFARGKRNILITGEGVLDGSGAEWWRTYREIRASGRREPLTPQELMLAELNPGYRSQASGGGGRELQFLRPPLLQFLDCQDIRVEHVSLRNSPFWNTHLLYSSRIHLQAVKFINPPHAPNTDGLDIDSCEDVLIQDCHFDVGDDCLAIKSGAGEQAIALGRPSRNITVRGCLMNAGHGGIVVGSETAGGVQNLKVEDCRMKDTDRGIRIKTRRGRGGLLENLEFRNISIDGCKAPLVINSYYRCGADPSDQTLFSPLALPLNPGTPVLRGIRVENLVADGCRASAGFIAGLPEAPIEGLSIRNCRIRLAPAALREDPSEAAMYAGLPAAENRGLRVLHAGNWEAEGLEVYDPDSELMPAE